MKISRHNYNYLKSQLILSSSHGTYQNDAIIVAGPRQTGKTTLILDILQDLGNYVAVNLEEERQIRDEIDGCDSFDQFAGVLKVSLGFDPTKHSYLFIDEAQDSKRLGNFVRSMKERWHSAKCILSGSSMCRLFNERSPVGRTNILLLTTLSFHEFLASKSSGDIADYIYGFAKTKNFIPALHERLLGELDDYLRVGGLPEVVTYYRDASDYLLKRRSILKLQEDDFLRKEALANQHIFIDCLKGVANNLGYPASYSQISASHREAKEISGLCSNWHIVHEIEQKTITTTTNIHPKRYIYDLGIARDLRAVPLPHVSILKEANPNIRGQLGGLVENMVLLSLLQNRMGADQISGWRENINGSEIDFVVNGYKTYPVECKASLKIHERNFSGIKKFLQLTGLKVGFLVSAAPLRIIKNNGLTLVNLPLYLAIPEVFESYL